MDFISLILGILVFMVEAWVPIKIILIRDLW